MKYAQIIFAVVALGALVIGTIRDPNFWSKPDQRGDALMTEKQYQQAAKTYTDPDRIGAAQYRNGDFKEAARTFARVPGADGAFNQANALLMHGKYDDAIASYDRALGFKPDLKEAQDNKAIAVARKAKLQASDEHRAEESADAYKPDQITFDQKGEDQKGDSTELSQQDVSDEALRATWLRQVQTTPADFLRAKFAYQASRDTQSKAVTK
jgi:Ca-activated chloride channel family protein